MSILSMMSSFVTPAMLGQVAALLGVQSTVVEKALNGAVPGLLAAVMGAAGTAQGKSAFSRALADQDPTMLDSFADQLIQNGAGVAMQGSDALSSILGAGDLTRFAGKLGDIAELPASAARSVTGLAGALIMGTLAKMSHEHGLDAETILSRLSDEADNIARALPAEFAEGFRSTGFLGALDAQVAAVSNAGQPRMSSRSTPAAGNAPAPPRARPWWPRAVLGLAVLFGLGWILGLFEAPDTADTVEADPAGQVVDGTDIGVQLQAALTGFGDQLTSVTDPASAEAALGGLNTTLDKLNQIQSTAENLPTEGRVSLQILVETALPSLRQTADGLAGNEAVQAVIGPILQKIFDALQALA